MLLLRCCGGSTRIAGRFLSDMPLVTARTFAGSSATGFADWQTRLRRATSVSQSLRSLQQGHKKSTTKRARAEFGIAFCENHRKGYVWKNSVLRGGRGKVMWLDPEDSSVPRGAALRRPADSGMSGLRLGFCPSPRRQQTISNHARIPESNVLNP